MPPEGKPLTAEQIALLKAWIEQGAKAPADEKPETDPAKHWAFQPVQRPAVPALRPSRPQPDRRLPRRRVAEARPQARRRNGQGDAAAPRLPRPDRPAADARGTARLPQRHRRPTPTRRWSTAARLARSTASAGAGTGWTSGATPTGTAAASVPDVLNSYGQIWRWRDWIVRSLNDDRGYDEMVRLMLAADELAPTNDADLVATGFVVRNFFRWNYNNWMRDNVEHTAQGVPRPDAQLLPLPRPQVRPDHAGRVFPLPRRLRADRDPPRPLARRSRPRRLPEVQLRRGVQADRVAAWSA